MELNIYALIMTVAAWEPEEAKFGSNIDGSNYKPDALMKSEVTKSKNKDEQLLVFKGGKSTILTVTGFRLMSGSTLAKATAVEEKKFTAGNYDVFGDRFDMNKRQDATTRLLALTDVPANTKIMTYGAVDESLYDAVRDAATTKDSKGTTTHKDVDMNYADFNSNVFASQKNKNSDGLGKQIDKGDSDKIKQLLETLAMDRIEFILSKLSVKDNKDPHVLEVSYNTGILAAKNKVAQSMPFCYDGKKYYMLGMTPWYGTILFKIIVGVVAITILLVSIYFGGAKKKLD